MKNLFLIILITLLTGDLKGQSKSLAVTSKDQVSENWADSVKKYLEIGSLYDDYGYGSVAIKYYNTALFFRDKADSVNRIIEAQNRMKDFLLRRALIENKYKIKLP